MLSRIEGRELDLGRIDLAGKTNALVFRREDFERNNISREALGRCAVVAAGHTLVGKKLGREIDAHDSVVRFAYPSPAASADTGQKTNVLVKRVCDFRTTIFREKKSAAVAFMPQHVNATLEAGLTAYLTAAKYCVKPRPGYEFWKVNRESSPFVWNGTRVLYDDVSFDKKGCADTFFSRIVLPCAMDGKLGKVRPTSGFKVIYTLLRHRACRSITVYGMDSARAECVENSSSNYGYIDYATGKPVTFDTIREKKGVDLFRGLRNSHSIIHECLFWNFYADELSMTQHSLAPLSYGGVKLSGSPVSPSSSISPAHAMHDSSPRHTRRALLVKDEGSEHMDMYVTSLLTSVILHCFRKVRSMLTTK